MKHYSLVAAVRTWAATQRGSSEEDDATSELLNALVDYDTQPMKCIRCGVKTVAGDNRLLVTFDGGYGDFIDPMDDFVIGAPDRTQALCGECAHWIVDNNGWLRVALGLGTPYNSDIAGHNTGCFCWEGSEAAKRFDEAIARQKEGR